MKKLGLVGGMGPESTIPYYHDIVYGVQKRMGRQIFPNMTMESLDVFRVLSLCKEEKYDEPDRVSSRCTESSESRGCRFWSTGCEYTAYCF